MFNQMGSGQVYCYVQIFLSILSPLPQCWTTDRLFEKLWFAEFKLNFFPSKISILVSTLSIQEILCSKVFSILSMELHTQPWNSLLPQMHGVNL